MIGASNPSAGSLASPFTAGADTCSGGADGTAELDSATRGVAVDAAMTPLSTSASHVSWL
jgi:hypothetical protein